jgi:hypothetical protein
MSEKVMKKLRRYLRDRNVAIDARPYTRVAFSQWGGITLVASAGRRMYQRAKVAIRKVLIK